MTQQDDTQNRIDLIMTLRGRGITDAGVLNAIETVPRHEFVSEAFRDYAYRDMALPVGQGQTIPEPYIMALICDALWLKEDNRVLLVGTGSGYLAAIVAAMVRRVYSIEIDRNIMVAAEQRFDGLGISNIGTLVDNGWKGWPEQAPYDRIILAASVDDLPVTLFEQLRVGGSLVYPQLQEDGSQQLIVLRKHEDRPVIETLCPVHFTPLLKGRE